MLELSAPVIAIVGPTASGKTDAAQIVAERLGGEVVSADSMQIYRGMDIGTGKLPASERRVPHHGFDLVDPGEPYSAALFQAFARHCIRDIDARGKRAVLCGGTGQYVQAAIDDFAFPKGDQVENPVRWEQTVRARIAQGVDTFVECGAGKTLSGLISKIDKDVAVCRVEDAATLSQTLSALGR